jgi:hypothetical protein
MKLRIYLRDQGVGGTGRELLVKTSVECKKEKKNRMF